MNANYDIYNNKSGQSQFQIQLEEISGWLSQLQISELYHISVSEVDELIESILYDEELYPDENVKEELISNCDGNQGSSAIKVYSLSVILAIGYRVKSPAGTIFRMWATEQLNRLIKMEKAVESDLKNASF